MEFKKDDNGLSIGYHWEGGETFVEGNEVPLSMATLDNSRILYMSNSVFDWFPDHLPKKELVGFRMYMILFIKPKEKTFTVFSEWVANNPCYDRVTNRYHKCLDLVNLIANGYEMFSMAENDRNEIPEAFLINPVMHVKNIELVPLVF